MPSGSEFVGAAGLRDALLSSDLFMTTLTEKLLTYALGRGVEARVGHAAEPARGHADVPGGRSRASA